MWWVMMIAMMLPSVMNRVEKFSNSRDINPFGFLGGYVLAWLAFSVVATGIQYFAGQVGWLHPVQMWSTNKGFSVILLMSASVFQFLPIKSTEYCVQKKETQFTKGLRYGANCVATMAPMMLVLFVGGVMNLYWIIGLTIIAIVEKTLCNKIVFRRIGALFALLAFIALIS